MSGLAFFGWFDQAAPPLFQETNPDPLRAATSFEFKLWSSNEILVDDAVLPLSSVLLTNGGMAYSPGVLNGSYKYQITAINSFGSAATPVLTAQFAAPDAAPNIIVTRIGNTNDFQVKGTGFGAWNGQSVLVNADAGLTFIGGPNSVQQSVTVSQGAFTTNVHAAAPCDSSGGSGSPLRFYVSLKNQLGNISNVVTGLSCI